MVTPHAIRTQHLPSFLIHLHHLLVTTKTSTPFTTRNRGEGVKGNTRGLLTQTGYQAAMRISHSLRTPSHRCQYQPPLPLSGQRRDHPRRRGRRAVATSIVRLPIVPASRISLTMAALLGFNQESFCRESSFVLISIHSAYIIFRICEPSYHIYTFCILSLSLSFQHTHSRYLASLQPFVHRRICSPYHPT